MGLLVYGAFRQLLEFPKRNAKLHFLLVQSKAIRILNPSFSGKYHKSSQASNAEAALVQDGVKIISSATDEWSKQTDPLDLSFSDHESAFKSKSNLEILRALFVFEMCSIKPLVENNAQLMRLGQKVLGKYLFGKLMKATFYGHFVAGENQQVIQPTLEKLRSFGVKSILDYSSEEDITPTKAEEREMKSCNSSEPELKKALTRFVPNKRFGDRRSNVVGARTYFYLNEENCDQNMKIFLNCIDAVSDATHGTGFGAIKMTALGRPQLLMQLSDVIVRARLYFARITGKYGGPIISHDMSMNTFEEQFRGKNISIDDPEVHKWLKNMTYDKKGLIHLFPWSGLINNDVSLKEFFQVPNLETGKMERLITSLTDEEEEMFTNMIERLHTIFSYAKKRDVRVMVDAEQSYFQPAISRLTMEMMTKYNKEKAIVFNTYQCYLKEAYDNLVLDLEQCHRQNFYFGAKLVRGAYMNQERARAQELKYDDPINPSFEATTEMFNKCLQKSIREIKRNKAAGNPTKVAMMVASHNEETVRYTVSEMALNGIHPLDRVICFGQLLGMCDHISLPLGQAGFSVYKYVPYGPVNDVLPYLSRRASENSSILSKLKKEKRLLRRELMRRISSGQIFYIPKGHYRPIGAKG